MRVNDLIYTYNILQKVKDSNEISVTKRLKIMKDFSTVMEQMKIFKKLADEIFKKYCIEENGEKIIKKDSENFKQYKDEINELNNIEIDLTVEKLKVTNEEIDKLKLTANDLYFGQVYLDLEE